MSGRWLGAAGLLAAYAVVAARAPKVPGRRERAVFERVNDSGGQPWLRVPQQWGTPWTLPAVAALAAVRRQGRWAVVVLACLPVEKGIEVATKKVRPRPRPLYVQPTVLRDDAPIEGGSMPSGHAALSACSTLMLAPLVPRPVTAVMTAVVGLSAWTRVHQGAHEPVDVAAGLLLGSGIGLAATELGTHWPGRRQRPGPTVA
ncbi:PAP2 superfamily protein [Nocardioides terrae]|uniref:PAP2 superfamily protein n=1 Tax=Nocardioides terrae TaxID=574651 RepID=A0A1I1IEF4_9ACTN|nr:phosphatase PAP2 family protein [Nocardioides terrae]SFC34062.1 PAP2 superfamily protein [Nocardioides terrae]